MFACKLCMCNATLTLCCHKMGVFDSLKRIWNLPLLPVHRQSGSWSQLQCKQFVLYANSLRIAFVYKLCLTIKFCMGKSNLFSDLFLDIQGKSASTARQCNSICGLGLEFCNFCSDQISYCISFEFSFITPKWRLLVVLKFLKMLLTHSDTAAHFQQWTPIEMIIQYGHVVSSFR